MDFMKILKSLEQALYEVMVWLVFYPLTMWRVVTAPGAMMAYADDELDDADEDRYSDKLSPPVFLALTLGLAHIIEIGLGQENNDTGFLAEDTNLLAFRAVVYSTYPLVLAVRILRMKGIALDRKTLRPPFYAQCYVAVPWAVVVTTVPLLAFAAQGETIRALLIALGGIFAMGLWYITIQARWFARMLGISVWRGLGHAVWTFIEATVLVVLITAAATAV